MTSEGRGDGTTSTICLPAVPLPDGTAEARAEHQHPRPGPGWLQPLVSSISPRTRTLHTPHASSPTPGQRCMEKAQASPGETVGASCLGDWAWGRHTCASFPSLGGRVAEDQTDVTRQGHSTVGPGTRPPWPQAPLSPGGAVVLTGPASDCQRAPSRRPPERASAYTGLTGCPYLWHLRPVLRGRAG